MNLFCTLLGHTWVPMADNPRTAWNAHEKGHTLVARPSAAPRFYEQCARCHERRDVQPPRVGAAARPKDA